MKRLLFLVSVGVLVSGCASTLHGTSQEVGFRSVPTGATVSISGLSATTPTKLTLKRGSEHTATFTLSGFPERQANLKQKLDGAFYGNIALGGIIGMAVDMGNGAAYNLSPGNVEMDMGTGLAREFEENEPIRVAEPAPNVPVIVPASLASPPMGAPPPPPAIIMPPNRPLDERLKELDDLKAAGRISEEEYIALRRKVIDTHR